MQMKYTSAIRGLGIACVVFSALTIVGCLFGFLVVGVGGYAANEYGPDAIRYSYNVGDHSLAGHMGEHDLTEGDLMGILNFAVLLGGVLVAWELIAGIVTLIAGIMCIRNAANREKLGGVFGWSIAGGIAALLSVRIITAALFVIAAVLAHKDKNAPEQPVYTAYAEPVNYAYQQPGAPYAQTYGAPQPQPAAQPAPQPTPAPQQPQPQDQPKPGDAAGQ